jgi:hypothetical protein
MTATICPQLHPFRAVLMPFSTIFKPSFRPSGLVAAPSGGRSVNVFIETVPVPSGTSGLCILYPGSAGKKSEAAMLVTTSAKKPASPGQAPPAGSHGGRMAGIILLLSDGLASVRSHTRPIKPFKIKMPAVVAHRRHRF